MIIGALLLSAGCLTAQDSPTQDTATHGYRSFFGSESTVWLGAYRLYDVPNMIPYYYTTLGDTIINGREYIIWGCSNYAFNPIDGFVFDDDYYAIRLMREDTLTGKLWISDINCYHEMLYVDMSLNIGDTFENGSVVRIVYYDSLGRKVIQLNDGNRFVEGVGPDIFVGDYLLNTPYLHVICSYHDGELQYKNSNLDPNLFDVENCYIVYHERITSTEKNSIAIYPNPCHSFFEIELSEESQISMYDGLGHIILRKKVYSGKEIIDITSLAAGCYYLNIANSDIFRWYKIIKK